jgi:tetratricopeptide (TPR) repeat protein
MNDAAGDSSPALRGWEHVRRATDELRAAVRDYEHAIKNDPGEPKNHYQLVQALTMLGQAHDAIARYRGRDDLISLRCLAQAYVADGRWKEAATTIACAPDDPFMLEQHAEMLARTGREQEALATWQRALDADPDSIWSAGARGPLLQEQVHHVFRVEFVSGCARATESVLQQDPTGAEPLP